MWPNDNYNKNIFFKYPNPLKKQNKQKKKPYSRTISPSGILDYMKHLFR